MSEKMNETQVPLTCGKCGCVRQVRTQFLVQTPPPEGAKTICTYIKTACPACGSETEHLIFADPGWTVQDGDRQAITCPCGGTSFKRSHPPAENVQIERGTTAAFQYLTCPTCLRETFLFIFSGHEVLTDRERQALLAGEVL